MVRLMGGILSLYCTAYFVSNDTVPVTRIFLSESDGGGGRFLASLGFVNFRMRQVSGRNGLKPFLVRIGSFFSTADYKDGRYFSSRGFCLVFSPVTVIFIFICLL